MSGQQERKTTAGPAPDAKDNQGRKVSLDPTNRYSNGMQMHMDSAMGMMDPMMMGMAGNPYMHPMEFPGGMPMGPTNGMAMHPGMMMDQMMDFPPPSFPPPPSYRGMPSDSMSHAYSEPGLSPPRDFMVPRERLLEEFGSPSNMSAPSALISSGGLEKRQRAPTGTSFPTKLYKILSDPQYKEYIAWLPHGRAWRVLKPKQFEEKVIPKFFRSDRYASFMRQVSLWSTTVT
jgi:hypothetical protein